MWISSLISSSIINVWQESVIWFLCFILLFHVYEGCLECYCGCNHFFLSTCLWTSDPCMRIFDDVEVLLEVVLIKTSFLVVSLECLSIRWLFFNSFILSFWYLVFMLYAYIPRVWRLSRMLLWGCSYFFLSICLWTSDPCKSILCFGFLDN